VRLGTGGAWAMIGWPINKGDTLTPAVLLYIANVYLRFDSVVVPQLLKLGGGSIIIIITKG
jgi:hypothetical protein